MAPESADDPRRGRVAQDGSSILSSVEFQRLIREAQTGSDSALGELIRSCQGYLLLVANQELGSNLQAKLGASDAVHSALVQAQQHIEQFRGRSRAELLAWLRKILRNEINAAQQRFRAEQRDVRREVRADDDSQQQTFGSVADDQPSPCTEAIMAEEATRRPRPSFTSAP
jgi:DNA-directed RNA polymerase specialized sigma24 family protein